MTLTQFRNMLASLPQSIDVVHLRGLKDVFPRLVWQEGRIEQIYASDRSVSEKTVVVAEYLTKDEEDPNVDTVKQLFRDNSLPFVCECTYDEENDVISYMFNSWLEEDVT